MEWGKKKQIQKQCMIFPVPLVLYLAVVLKVPFKKSLFWWNHKVSSCPEGK